MTFEEVGNELPNGFHDSNLRAIAIDYVTQEARFVFDIDVSDESLAERSATLFLEGLAFCVIDPPDSNYPFDQGDRLWIDSVPLSKMTHLPGNLPPTPEGAFGHCFFVHNWNSFIYFAARNARLEWHEDGAMSSGT